MNGAVIRFTSSKGVYLRTRFQQRSDNFHVTIYCGGHKCSPVVSTLKIHIGASFNQRLNKLDMPVDGSSL
ncbi:hypothetical protein RRF57_009364 [Xylaria bambusicola]|uniref:Uncharacterized protein n=1 Tax=Xylaria bambusicola TaxID=326684 RepID=A0AAN7Z1J3_9PEZI